jgi:GAF domain-containing protein
MANFQSVAEDLLLETGASRAMLHLVAPSGGLSSAGEVVTHGARQIRNDESGAEPVETSAVEQLKREKEVLTQDDLEQAEPADVRDLIDRYGVRARALAPLILRDRFAGIISLHDVRGPRHWSARDIEAVRKAQSAALAVLEERESWALTTSKEDLRDAAIQAILDCLRHGLRVQRCTLRQNVSAAYAFPVTHESRADGVWSLRGDFTIDQRHQPVILKMLAERVQVVQNDTRSASTEPVFHTMLKHYGDMRAQMVTPLFREDSLAGAVSVHDLKEVRTWTPEETALARSASRMLGLVIGATLS